MKSLSGKNFTHIFCFFLIILIFSISFLLYQKSVMKIITGSSENFLEETARLYKGIVNHEVEENFVPLQKLALEFNDFDLQDRDAVLKKLSAFSNYADLTSVIVSDLSGIPVDSKGANIGNISFRDYFQTAVISKTPQVSKNLISDLEGNPSLILVVPLFSDGQVSGIVAGALNVSNINNHFSDKGLNTKGYFLIIQHDGNIIFSSLSKNKLCYEENLYKFFEKNRCWSFADSISFFDNLKYNRSGIFHYNLKENRRICYYSPLSMNEWYMLAVVPQDFLGKQQTVVSRITIILGSIIFLIFIFFFAVIYVVNKRAVNATLDSQRLNIVISKNQSLILDIDLVEKSITCTGDTLQLFGTLISKTDLYFLDKFMEKVHAEDKSSIENFKEAVFVTHTDFTSEFRLMCDDGEYNWYKLSTMTIYNEEHKPLKCMATFENVNSRIQREQELQYKAEYDSLSGLLNKGGFERKVQEYIAAKNGNICALFVIDLDNFKTTNDTLGHAMGDAAIRDTAKKISLIFSIKDYIGRIGGDEFCVFTIFDKLFTEEECITLLTEKAKSLCEIINEMYFNEEKYVEISSSIGIALFPSQGKTYKDLFRLADNALYNVKNNGKNGYKFYSPELEEGSQSSYKTDDDFEKFI